MNRTASWKSITVGAVMTAMSFAGIATAHAAPAPAAPVPAPATMAPAAAPPAAPAPTGVTGTTTDCTTGGAYADRCQTNGSTAIHTAPRTKAGAGTSLSDLLRNPQAD